jgi:hypothetical protein
MKELQEKLERALLALKYGNVIRPHRDWLILLTISLIVFVGSAVWNAWLFNKVIRGEFLGDAPEVAPLQTLDTLETVKDVLEERRVKELFYRVGSSFVDPAGLTE